MLKGIMFSIVAIGALVSCAGNPYEAPTEEQMLHAQEASEARGVYRYADIDYDNRHIAFTYGNPELLEMNFSEYEVFIHRVLSDHTIVTTDHSQSHSVQVEYFSPAGEVFLWYPGNTAVVSGSYRTEISDKPFNLWGDRTAVLICFTYTLDSNGLAIEKTDSQEECTSAYSHISGIVGKKSGDPFNLKSGKVPFVTPRLASIQMDGTRREHVRGKTLEIWPDGSSLLELPAPHYASEP